MKRLKLTLIAGMTVVCGGTAHSQDISSSASPLQARELLPVCAPAEMQAHNNALRSGKAPKCRPAGAQGTGRNPPSPRSALPPATSVDQVELWRPTTKTSSTTMMRQWQAIDVRPAQLTTGRDIAAELARTNSMATGPIKVGTWTSGLYSAWLESSRVEKSRGDRNLLARERLASLPVGSAMFIAMRRAGSQNSGWTIANDGQWSFEGAAREYDVVADIPGASTREGLRHALGPSIQQGGWQNVDVAVYKKTAFGIVAKSLDAEDQKSLRDDPSGAALADRLDDQLEIIAGVDNSLPMRKAGHVLGGGPLQTTPSTSARTTKPTATTDASSRNVSPESTNEPREPPGRKIDTAPVVSTPTPSPTPQPTETTPSPPESSPAKDEKEPDEEDPWWITLRKSDGYPVNDDTGGPSCPVCVSNSDLRRAELDAALAFGAELEAGTLQIERMDRDRYRLKSASPLHIGRSTRDQNLQDKLRLPETKK